MTCFQRRRVNFFRSLNNLKFLLWNKYITHFIMLLKLWRLGFPLSSWLSKNSLPMKYFRLTFWKFDLPFFWTLFFTISSVFLSKTINNGGINFECQNANTVTHHSCSHGLTHTRSPVAMLGTVRQTLFSKNSNSTQFEKFERFINDEMLYRATNKNHHGQTWSIRQPMLLRLLICRSIMTRRYSLRGLRRVRGLSHGQRRYVLICVTHVDFDVFSEVINDQATFCVVYVDLDV